MKQRTVQVEPSLSEACLEETLPHVSSVLSSRGEPEGGVPGEIPGEGGTSFSSLCGCCPPRGDGGRRGREGPLNCPTQLLRYRGFRSLEVFAWQS